MSISYRVYLGPYLECEYSLIQTQRIKTICDNKDCPRYNKPPTNSEASFCGVCGQRFTSLPEEIEIPDVNKWDLEEEIDEALFPIPLEHHIKLDGLIHIWIPNKDRNAPRHFWTDPITDFQLTPLLPSDIRIECEWLRQSFANEKAILEKYYKRCDTMWGLIVYPM